MVTAAAAVVEKVDAREREKKAEKVRGGRRRRQCAQSPSERWRTTWMAPGIFWLRQ
jgi:hypothetical protein